MRWLERLHEPELASYLRVEERELEARGLSSLARASTSLEGILGLFDPTDQGLRRLR
jgi:hypothetical protein